MKGTAIDLSGQTFDRLTVIERDGSDLRQQAIWACVCSCGSRVSIRGTKLRSGHTKSCGCLLTDMNKEKNTTHGKSNTPEHKVWKGMIRRCYYESEKSYPRYGGKGVRVCDEWRNDFAAFLAHIGPRPSLKHSIDRIKNDKGYEPGNVRWATQEEQSRNRDCVLFYEFNGTRAQIPEFAEKYGIPATELRKRLWRGWSIERALTQPLRRSPLGRAAIERAVA